MKDDGNFRNGQNVENISIVGNVSNVENFRNVRTNIKCDTFLEPFLKVLSLTLMVVVCPRLFRKFHEYYSRDRDKIEARQVLL